VPGMRALGGASQRAARNDAQPQVEQHALPADQQAAENLVELRESRCTGSDGSDGRHDEPQPVPPSRPSLPPSAKRFKLSHEDEANIAFADIVVRRLGDTSVAKLLVEAKVRQVSVRA